jgi:hypothetical protein
MRTFSSTIVEYFLNDNIIYDAILFVKKKSHNKKGNDVSIIPLKLKKGGIASTR